MLRTTDDGIPYWLTIISAGRPENVPLMTEHVGAATWYVPPSQDEHYRFHGAHTAEGSDVAIVPVRNRALEDAWSLGVMCVQLDDDLRWSAVVNNGKAERLPAHRVLESLIRRLHDSDFRLGGAAPTNNVYFTRRSVSTNLFVRSGVLCVKKCELLFDPALRVKFDYDYTIQHYLRYGGVLRCDDLIFDFQQRSNKGGHVDTRSVEVEEEAIRYLLRKWPTLIRRHPRRAHEVLLRLPRRDREVLT